MKKTDYMAPEMEVVNIHVAKMLCVSQTAGQGGNGDENGELD